MSDKELAIAGVSSNPKKFGHVLFKTLRNQGFNVIPINPNQSDIEQITCLKTVGELSPDINNLLIVTPKRETEKVVKEAISKGIKNIWIQNGCETREAIQLAEQSGVNLVSKACFFMYANPQGIHKFHKTIAGWVGSYIKN